MAGSGLYVSLDGGANLVGDASKVKSNHAELGGSDWSFSFGFGFAGGVGYDFGDFRVDAEVSYLSSPVIATLSGTTPNKDDKRGNFTVFGGTANIWLDVDTGTAFTPYIGAGGGGALISYTISEDTPIPVLSKKVLSAWALAFQGGAGVVYQLTDAIGLDLGYRLFGIVNPQLKSTTKIVGDEYVTVSPGLMLTHRVNLGIDVAF
jgi:opacity protein-like surface antigen